jgi:endonuclease/exonuclease/phosphatase family metal-dependent hydrolase
MKKSFQKISTLRLLSILLGILILFAPVSPAFAEEPQIKVMSRNLYLGASIFDVIEVALADPTLLPGAVEVFWQTVQDTDFETRAKAIADEIKRYKPHLVGLQEVSTYRTQTPGDFLLGNFTPNAANVELDFLAILMAELEARKLKYSIAHSVTNADVEVPMLDGGEQPFTDLRLTDHDVILIRKDITASNLHTQRYFAQAGVPIEVAPGVNVPLEFSRGFVAIDANVDGYIYRFVNTHLETGGSVDFRIVQHYQMGELLGYLSTQTENPIILVGDLNSDPRDTEFDAGIHGTIYPPYSQAMTAGYIDVWDWSNKHTADFTCCFDDSVNDPSAELYERIDHVLLFEQNDFTLDEVRVVITGDEQQDMIDGLWPSDHAGVSAQIEFLP